MSSATTIRPGTTGPIPTTPSEPDTRRWWMLAVLLLGQFMGLVDVLIVNVALPASGWPWWPLPAR